MTIATLNLSLITPEKLLFSRSAEMVVVPGIEGEFGVLPGHISLVSVLKPGIVLIYNNATIEKKIFVLGGFVEVTAETCSILAEEASDLDEINKEALAKRFEQLNKSLLEKLASERDLLAAEKELIYTKYLLEYM
jgi:F-type H+-transporting ATPase subunit epsilon